MSENLNRKQKRIYINGAAAISPQNSLDFMEFQKGMIEYEADFLQSIKPNYKAYMKPIEARRMSKTVKNGIICAQIAMQEAKIEMPDAIIFGTGLGIVSDTENFLEKMLENKEQFLTPTSFIQSTHNTVAGQIANRIKCHNYNFTYVNRAFSFESVLTDAMLHIYEGKNNILAGGGDEMTEHYYRILKKSGNYKKGKAKNTDLFRYETPGTLCGEAVEFFVLSDKKNEASYAELKAVKTFCKSENIKAIQDEISDFLSNNALNRSDIDLVLTGDMGEKKHDAIYDEILKELFPDTAACRYKHLCGEFQTANAFGFWTAANMLKHQAVPDFMLCNEPKAQADRIKNILIYNHYFNINHSLILLSQV